MPTIPGDLIVQVQSPGNAECGGPPACSASPQSLVWDNGSLAAPWQGQETITYLAPNATRFDLDQELGHQFDWALLTTAHRQRLAKLMEQWSGRLPWWDSETPLDEGSEDGLESEFAVTYAECARAPLHGQADPRICALIDTVGGWPQPHPAAARAGHRVAVIVPGKALLKGGNA